MFACGRYEGIDARVVEDARTRMDVDEVSIGDYVLPGGESAVLVMVEAVCRLLPGVMGNAQSASDDSFGGGGAARWPAWSRDRPTPGRGSGGARRCRPCCSPAITRPSPDGAATAPCAAPPQNRPTW